jgi:hypothetical protein
VTDESVTGPRPSSVELLAAALRADDADLGSYARVLLGAFAESLPAGMLEVVRERSFADRVAGRPGEIRMIRARFGEVVLELAEGRGAVVGTVVREVRGVTISRKQVALGEWTKSFAAELSRYAAEHAAARQAMARFLGAE